MDIPNTKNVGFSRCNYVRTVSYLGLLATIKLKEKIRITYKQKD